MLGVPHQGAHQKRQEEARLRAEQLKAERAAKAAEDAAKAAENAVESTAEAAAQTAETAAAALPDTIPAGHRSPWLPLRPVSMQVAECCRTI